MIHKALLKRWPAWSWLVLTVAWAGSLAWTANASVGDACTPRHVSGTVVIADGGWTWTPPGRVCGYAAGPAGRATFGDPDVAVTGPSWWPVVLVSAGWVVVLGAAIGGVSGRKAE